MKRAHLIFFIISAATLCGCATTPQRASRGVVVTRMDAVLPADQNQRSLWLSANVDTEESKFSSQTTRNWKRNYEVFSKALLIKANSSGFDSASLSKILKLILADTNGKFLAYVPIAAYATELNSEPVWIVVVHWELTFGPEDLIPIRPLSHVRIFAFTQKDLMQVAFLTCG
jgi:hypothetical protein